MNPLPDYAHGFQLWGLVGGLFVFAVVIPWLMVASASLYRTKEK